MKINKNLLLALTLGAAIISTNYVLAQEVEEFTEEAAVAVPQNAIPRLVEPASEEAQPAPASAAADFMTADLSIATKPAQTVTPEAAQPIAKPVAPAIASEVATPEATKPLEGKPLVIVEPVPIAGKTSQTLEESLGLQPSKAAQEAAPVAQAAMPEKPLQLPEIAQLPEPTVQAQPTAPAIKPSVQTLIEPEKPKSVALKSDEETCTELCKKVCVGLKDEERKALELEDTQKA